MSEGTVGDLDIPQRLLDLAEQGRARPELRGEGLRARLSAQMTITSGQVWRARWDDVIVLVLVLDVMDREVRAVPVTIDPPVEDEHCLVLSEDAATVFGVEVTAWAGMVGGIPVRVLDQPIDAWDDALVQGVRDAAASRAVSVPPSTRRGKPIRSELDPAAALRAHLTDDLDSLRNAPSLPAETPGITTPTLAELLGPELDLAALCTALGLPQPQVMTLLRGKAVLTPDQVDTVARATGLSVEQINGTFRPLPLAQVVRMEHPRWRSVWTQRARQLHLTEEQARLRTSYNVFAMAARETGGQEPDWDQRLARFLQDEHNPVG
jgi:hypothetical protein